MASTSAEMDSSRPNIVIVGAGVVGLSTAVRLAEDGHHVRVLADKRGDRTTSAAAGAVFDPFMSKHPLSERWAHSSMAELDRLAKDEKSPFVQLLSGIEASRTLGETPDNLPLNHVECSPEDLPPGFVRGWRYQTPIVAMPAYLKWLEERLEIARGQILPPLRLKSLNEAFIDTDIVINCSGIGAHALVPDDAEIQPVRGQLVVMENPGIRDFFVEHVRGLDASESTYLIPHGNELLLGGSEERGEYEAVAQPDVARKIVKRCLAAFPAIAGKKILGHRVGIRPHRSEIRLEHERFGSRLLIHNYGHGGSGVSLAWGCADEVARVLAKSMCTS